MSSTIGFQKPPCADHIKYQRRRKGVHEEGNLRLPAIKIEIRATGLRAMREKRGLTQRQLAKEIGLSQNYLPGLESGARKPGPDLRDRLLRYFACDFEELFHVVLLDPRTSSEQRLRPTDHCQRQRIIRGMQQEDQE